MVVLLLSSAPFFATASGTSIGNGFVPCQREGQRESFDVIVGDGQIVRETYICRNGRIVNLTPVLQRPILNPRATCIEGESLIVTDPRDPEIGTMTIVCKGGKFRRVVGGEEL